MVSGHLIYYMYNYVQNTFWQSGNDSKWVLQKKHFWKKTLTARETNGKCH